MQSLTDWIEHLVGTGRYAAVVETALVVILYLVLRLSITRAAHQAISKSERRFRLIKGSNFLLNCLLLLVLFQLWFSDNWSMASFVGLLSAGLAFVLREPLLNMAGWLFIVTRQPFALGHRIEVEGTAGDVIDIGVYDFTLMEIGNWVAADQSTGRIVHLPNSYVFTKAIANYHQGFPFLWHELTVVLTYESDWEKGIELLQKIADRVCEVDRHEREEIVEELNKQENYLIHFKHLTPIVYMNKNGHGIALTLRYLCQPRRRRSTETTLWKEILKQFASQADLQFAYETQRWVDTPPLLGAVKEKS